MTPEQLKKLTQLKDIVLTAQEVKKYTDALAATKQDVIEDLQQIREGAAAGAEAVQPDGLLGLIDNGTYDSDARKILLRHGTTVISEIDADPFIKDGMISNVMISPTVQGEAPNLVITFNTDAGKNPISIPLSSVFNPTNYYTKTEADSLIGDLWDETDAVRSEVIDMIGYPVFDTRLAYLRGDVVVYGGRLYLFVSSHSAGSKWNAREVSRISIRYKLESLYEKPKAGIPFSDLEDKTQEYIEQGHTAYQKPASGIPASDLADGVIPDISGLQEALVSGENIKTVNGTSLLGSGNITIQGGGGVNVQADWDEDDSSDDAYIRNKPTLATVATSGSYNDLTDKPTIPSVADKANQKDITTVDVGTVLDDYSSTYLFNFSGEPTHTAICRVNGEEHLIVCAHHNGGSGTMKYYWDFLGTQCVAKYNDSNAPTWVTDLFFENFVGDVKSAYQKPSGGIPSTDLASDVQTTLGKVTTIEGKIPSAATSENQLADKAFVNSSIDTATATFRGSYNLVSDLSLTISDVDSDVTRALTSTISIANSNDYCFVQVPAANDTPTVIARVDRYKFGGYSWYYEYTLNNSGFTAAQWAALNSAITSGLVSKLSALPTNSELSTSLGGKADKVTGATNGNFAGLDANGNLTDSGSKASDFATSSQGAKADTAYQKPSGGIPSTDLASAVQSLLTAAGTALQPSDITTLTSKVTALEELVATDSDSVIDKFNEIVTFLDGINASNTLSGMLGDIATQIGAKYTKPSGGIPSTDLASSVQTSLGKADSAIQSVKVNGTALTPDANKAVDVKIPNDYQVDYAKQYLTFEALEDGTISFIISSGINTDLLTSISYSVDNGSTWTTINNEDDKEDNIQIDVNVNEGDKVLWKGNALALSDDMDNVSSFVSEIEINVYGNIMSLLYGDNFINQTSLPNIGCNFYKLFATNINSGADVVNAENLILPATTLANLCYQYMFYGCTLLTTAPALPATTLADSCYFGMFQDCTSLVNAPELPATTLASYCYNAMFYGCTSLVTAPALPATTLADSCYSSMFWGCTSLNYIKCLATDISATDCTYDWVSNVAASGTFVKADSMTSWTTDDDGIPNGWTVYTESEYELAHKYEVNAKYSKPSGGIPSTDLAQSVQTSLGKADTAVQPSAIANMQVTTNKVTSWQTTPDDTHYPSEKLVYDEIGNVEDVLDAVLGSETLPTQRKMGIVSAVDATDPTDPITTLSTAVNTYYTIPVEVGTLAITLPEVTDTIHIQNIVFMLTTGSTPAVTFAAAGTGVGVIAQDGFSIEASTTYEINAIFNGVAWVIAAMKLNTTDIQPSNP